MAGAGSGSAVLMPSPVKLSVGLKISKEPKRRKVGAMRVMVVARSRMALPSYLMSRTTLLSEVTHVPARVVGMPWWRAVGWSWG